MNNASQAFRSHLMQQFAATARNQARTPIALVGWVDSADDDDNTTNNQTNARTASILTTGTTSLREHQCATNYTFTKTTTNSKSSNDNDNERNIIRTSNRNNRGLSSTNTTTEDQSLKQDGHHQDHYSRHQQQRRQSSSLSTTMSTTTADAPPKHSPYLLPSPSMILSHSPHHERLFSSFASNAEQAEEEDGDELDNYEKTGSASPPPKDDTSTVSTTARTTTTSLSTTQQHQQQPTELALAFQTLLQTRRTNSHYRTPILSSSHHHHHQQQNSHAHSNIKDSLYSAPTLSTNQFIDFHDDNYYYYKAALDRAVAAGMAAPNHKKTEPFAFKRLLGRSPTTDRLADIAARVYRQKEERRKRIEQQQQQNNSSPFDDDDNNNWDPALMVEVNRKRDKWRQVPAFLVTLVTSTSLQIPLNSSVSSEIDDNAVSAATLVPDVFFRLKEDNDDNDDDDDYYEPMPFVPPTSERELEDYAAACAATQNVLLSLHSEDLASKWATGSIVHTPAFRSLIQAAPTDRVVALILVGQAASSRSSPRRHRAVWKDNIVHDL